MEDVENGKTNFAIAKDVAKKEVERWLDSIKATESQKESYAANIDRLVEAVQDGTIVIDEKSNEITHTLKFPFGEEIKIITLTYKNRLKVKDITNAQRGIKNDDGDGRVLGYVVALTGQAREVLRNMAPQDFQISEAIAPFFAI